MQVAVNFALYSAGATGVILCLFTEADLQNGKVSFEVQLDVNLLYGKFLASCA